LNNPAKSDFAGFFLSKKSWRLWQNRGSFKWKKL